MPLYAVTVTGVYPPQCIVVWDRKASADALAAHLNATIAPDIEVQEVESFFPAGMTNADTAWLAATDAYLRGAHINTSGEHK